MHVILPCVVALRSRGVEYDELCRVCGLHVETISYFPLLVEHSGDASIEEFAEETK